MPKTNILEEIRMDQGKPTQCQFCAWLSQQTSEDRLQWNEALGDRTITTTSIERAVARRVADGKPPSVDTHRRKGHKVVA